MSIYPHLSVTTDTDHQDITRSGSFLSFDQENVDASSWITQKPQEGQASEDLSKLSKSPSRSLLRARNDNIPSQAVFDVKFEHGRRDLCATNDGTKFERQLSLRSLSSNGSALQDSAPRLPLPLLDDPVIAKAVESSLTRARSSSLPGRAAQETSQAQRQPPFRRWIDKLNKNTIGRKAVQPGEERWSLDEFDDDPIPGEKKQAASATSKSHRKSISWASGSSAFVTAARSARQSLSTLSETATDQQGRSTLTKSSTKDSYHFHGCYHHLSGENKTSEHHAKEAAWGRSVKRGQVLDELLDSEESYLSDLKALLNVYSTLHGSTLELSKSNISRMQQIVDDIFNLHEDLLRRLSGLRTDGKPLRNWSKSKRVLRRQQGGNTGSYGADLGVSPDSDCFADVRDSLGITRGYSKQANAFTVDPRQAGYAAHVFDSVMHRFFVYEEYGATYETMLIDMSSATKSIPNWESYQRGFEALANVIAPEKYRLSGNKKGLTLEDLLIKPIQRICKYPLLFADLYKQTPVIDGPEAHMKLEKVLFRLRETAAEINKATNDKLTQDIILRSWKIQDIFFFEDAITAPYMLRALGHVVLCGVLHVAYQSGKTVVGEYMSCALFRRCLLLAIPSKMGYRKSFQVSASIPLANIRLESTENGRGLQCHTAPFSWKIFFESDQELYELIFNACSSGEEKQWRTHLTTPLSCQSQRAVDKEMPSLERFSMLCLDIKPIGKVLGQPGSLVRRLSMQRAATVGSRPNHYQVIIKNTCSLKQQPKDSKAHNEGAVGRSQSVLSTNSRIPILAPRRAERVRIEQDMAEIWTKELLPYPGMESAHLDHHIRASASSVLRKLSRSSLATSLSRRSASQINGEVRCTGTICDKNDHDLDLVHSPNGLLPVIESPIGSARESTSCQSNRCSPVSNSAKPTKRSASAISKIKRRVSEAGISVASKGTGCHVCNEAHQNDHLFKIKWSRSSSRLPRPLSSQKAKSP